MSEKTKHTPTPWRVSGSGRTVYAKHPHGFTCPVTVCECDVPCDAGGIRTQPFSDETIENNAAHIVKCVNSHAQLVARLAEWVEYFDDLERHSDPADPLFVARRKVHGDRMEKSRAALAAANAGK